MTTTTESTTREMTWRYPERDGQPYVLREGGADAGWLEFHDQPGARSTGEFNGRRIEFEYTAELHPRVLVRHDGSQDLVAEYVPNLAGGGVVSFASGARYRWRRSNVFGAKWCFCQQENKRSVCVSQESGPLAHGGKTTLCCGAAGLPETPVLLLLAWFLRIMEFEMLGEGLSRMG